MTLQHIKDVVRAEVAKYRTWVSAGLLAALPWADDIRSTINTNLPALQPYLPENIYKFMGGAVVVAGMVMSVAASHRALKAQQ